MEKDGLWPRQRSWLQSLIHTCAIALFWWHVVQDYCWWVDDWYLCEATKPNVLILNLHPKNRQKLCLWTKIMSYLKRNNWGWMCGCHRVCLYMCQHYTVVLKFLGCDFETSRAFPQTSEIQREALWNLFEKEPKSLEMSSGNDCELCVSVWERHREGKIKWEVPLDIKHFSEWHSSQSYDDTFIW